MISISNHKKQVPFQLYKLKKSKQPNHLLNMIQKTKKQKQNIDNFESNTLDMKVKQAIRRHMIQKRVNNILTLNQKNIKKSPPIISQPVKWVQKEWVPPIQKEILSKKFSQEQLLLQSKKQQEKRMQNKQHMKKILNIIYLNKKMRYFGDYLASEYDGQRSQTKGKKLLHSSGVKSNQFSICNIPKTKQSKLSFLQARFKALKAKSKPKLFLLNSPLQKQKYFYNPLIDDQYFSTIIRNSDTDQQLVKILIRSLQEQGHFSLTSFIKFYDIFVWQTASKADLTKFATKILMGDNDQLPITKISSTIDFICQKINLQDLNHSLQNFSQIMKKLLFGEQFVFALKNQYFLTRKALMESLQRNQECISIFANVFYI